METLINESKFSRKEKNKSKVIKYALINFIENGIEFSKISKIAKDSGLTERSVYRYFKTKEELVLETAFLFWEYTMEYVNSKCSKEKMNEMSGIDRIKYVLSKYSEMYFIKRKELIFIHEAESYLSRCGKSFLIFNRYPVPYEESKGPLATAIRKGIEDGTVDTDLEISILYYNTFDSMLGLIQKLAISTGVNDKNFSTLRKRLDYFCELLVSSYRKKASDSFSI